MNFPRHSRVARAATTAGVVVLLSLEWASGCKSSSEGTAPPPLTFRGECLTHELPPQCGQTCQDNRVGYALYNAGWLLYNQNVAGMPAGPVTKTASCPLGGMVAVSGSVTVATNGVTGTQLTFDMMNCGVSAATYSLTFTGALQMNGTFTAKTQDDITFSSSNLSLAGQLKVLDDPSVNETCSVSMTDTWNYDPKEVGWLSGLVCGRSADGTALGADGAETVPDTKCLLAGMELTENGQPVEFDDVPDNAFAAADAGVTAPEDGGVSTTGALDPQITNVPASMSFVNGATQPLDLAFTDPTASRPAFFMTLRPTGSKLKCFMCCTGCRATHRVFDKLTRGVAHYEATTALDPTLPSAGDLIIYPVSCSEPGVDPVKALAAGGGAGCTPVIGAPIPVGITFAPPTTGGSSGSGGSGGSSGGSSGSAGSSSSGGSSGSGHCTSNSDCASVSLSNCGMLPGEPNNGGVCDAAGDRLCHCCYGTCKVDPQTLETSGCTCAPPCSSSSDCDQITYPTCAGGFCVTKSGLPP
jgi:uncharacterized membrane protein YgcG